MPSRATVYRIVKFCKRIRVTQKENHFHVLADGTLHEIGAPLKVIMSCGSSVWNVKKYNKCRNQTLKVMTL
jgi:hypothetical protein